jgi:hypothetical protein
MLRKQRNHRLCGHVVARFEAELGEDGVLADEIGNGVFELVDDRTQRCGVRLGLQVFDGVELDTELFGNPNRVDGTVSIRVVQDGDVGHGAHRRSGPVRL